MAAAPWRVGRRVLRYVSAPLLVASMVLVGASGAEKTARDQPCSIAAGTAGANRVLLVIQTGDDASSPVRPVCVRFGEESISGAEALLLADVDVVSKGYAGRGVPRLAHPTRFLARAPRES